MSSFLIQNASGAGAVEFFARTPTDPARPLERFSVRLELDDLSALTRVYDSSHPAPLFAQMAENWQGWPGVLSWQSPDGELALRSSISTSGHVSLRVELASGPTGNDWRIQATLFTEAGQLDELAQAAAAFFGVVAPDAIAI